MDLFPKRPSKAKECVHKPFVVPRSIFANSDTKSADTKSVDANNENADNENADTADTNIANTNSVVMQRTQSQASQLPPILRIPKELQLEIFSHAEDNDQLCLALTCKQLLQVSTMVNLELPSSQGHMKLLPCPRMQDLLNRIRPLDAQGREITTIALCVDCHQYQPKAVSYWVMAKTRQQTVNVEDWYEMVVKWTMQNSERCPACQLFLEKWRESYTAYRAPRLMSPNTTFRECCDQLEGEAEVRAIWWESFMAQCEGNAASTYD